MSDWTKLETIAEMQKALANLQSEIIESQTHIKYDGPIGATINNVRAAYDCLERNVLDQEK